MSNYSIIPLKCGDGSRTYGVKCAKTGACVYWGSGASDAEIISDCESQVVIFTAARALATASNERKS